MNNVQLDSPALKLAQEMNALYESEVWILDFEQNLNQHITFDQINKQIDSNTYPTLEKAMETYNQWKKEIDRIDDSQKKLSNLSLRITPELNKLKAANLPPEQLQTINFLQPNLGAQIDAIHTSLAAEVAKLEVRLKRIDSIWQKAKGELHHIERHPLARLKQTIEHIKAGRQTSSLVSYTTDKIIRNTSSLYEQFFGSTKEKTESKG
jgi:hypothetical protein